MPIVQISVVEGREPEALKCCAKEVARTIHRTLGAPLSSIRVFIHEVPPAYFAVGDETRDEIDAAKAAAASETNR